jgi:molecular chaperone HscB
MRVQPEGVGQDGPGSAGPFPCVETDEPMNYFEVFGLPRRLVLDPDELQRRFYELSRQHHPDFHQGADAATQARALEASALVNAAYRTLREPIARVAYLLRLEEGDVPPPDGRAAPPELLAELFEIQETLAEAGQGRLEEAMRERLRAERDRLAARRAAEERQLTDTLARAWDAASGGERPRILAEARRALAARAYLRTVIDDLDAALGADGESRVANRRD